MKGQDSVYKLLEICYITLNMVSSVRGPLSWSGSSFEGVQSGVDVFRRSRPPSIHFPTVGHLVLGAQDLPKILHSPNTLIPSILDCIR